MEGEEQEDLNSIEYYIQALRKKVDHQLKNPFSLDFANYSFDKLINWKNNVLQLDATSRLYGQRVDYLHSGTLHVLGTVINLDLQSAHTANKKEGVQKAEKQAIEESTIFQRYLESPEKLDDPAPPLNHNFLQWRQIMRKRDTLPLLMLNQLGISPSLRLPLVRREEENKLYDECCREESGYLKLINFSLLNQQQLIVFAEIEEVVKESESFWMRLGDHKKQQPRQSLDISSFIEFEFPLASSQKLYLCESTQIANLAEGNDLGSQNHALLDHNYDNSQPEQGLGSQLSSQTFSLYSINTQSTVTIRPQKKKSKKGNKMGQKKEKEQCFIDFTGLHPSRQEVFSRTQDLEQPFLLQKDHLHLKYIKRRPLFTPKARNRIKPSRNRPSFNLYPEIGTSYFQLCPSKQRDTSGLQDFNTGLQLTKFASVLSKKTQIVFREAALSIKQLKKRIREKSMRQKEVVLSEVISMFEDEEPLDIFISVLHVAAEDSLFIRK